MKGESRAKERARKKFALFPSRTTHASRSPRFRFCSPKIRKRIAPFLYACWRTACLPFWLTDRLFSTKEANHLFQTYHAVLFLTWWSPLTLNSFLFHPDDPLQHGDDFDTLSQWEYCDCQHKTIWFGVLFATKGLLLLFGVFLAWETRNVNIPALNDSRYVGMSVYNVVILSVVGVPAALMIERAQNATFALTAFFIIFCTTVTLCLVFVPKVRKNIANLL